MKYCTTCWRELPDDAVFCKGCGSRQAENHSDTYRKTDETDFEIIIDEKPKAIQSRTAAVRYDDALALPGHQNTAQPQPAQSRFNTGLFLGIASCAAVILLYVLLFVLLILPKIRGEVSAALDYSDEQAAYSDTI